MESKSLDFPLRSLRLCGALPSPFKDDAVKPRLNFVNKLLLGCSWITLIHLICLTIFNIIKNRSVHDMFTNANAVFRYIVVVTTLHHFFNNIRKILAYLKDLWSFLTPLDANQIHDLTKECSSISWSAWIYFVLIILTTSLSIKDANIPRFFKSFFYNTDVSGYSLASQRIFVTLDWFAFVLPLCVVPFVISVFVCSCHHLRAKTVQFNERLRNMLKNEVIQVEHLHWIHKTHTSLFEFVQKLDRIYSPLVFIWYAEILANVLFIGPSIVLKVISGSIYYWNAIVDCTHYVVLFFQLSLAAAGISERISETVRIANQLLGKINVEDWRAQPQMFYVLFTMNNSRMTLTGWEFFNIDKGFILTVSGATISYAVIIIQLLPRDD